MTAPVIQSINDESEQWTVSFAMPSKYNIDDLPKPENNEIYFQEIQPSLAAVIKFSGKADDSLLNQKTNTLKNWLELNGYTERSSPKFLFFTISFCSYHNQVLERDECVPDLITSTTRLRCQ